jgi:hypothetical protein
VEISLERDAFLDATDRARQRASMRSSRVNIANITSDQSIRVMSILYPPIGYLSMRAAWWTRSAR